MKKIAWNTADFVLSALDKKGYPLLRDDSGKILFEIALIGRSNVGKSSLINSICEKKQLAKSSKTPGKTHTLNFFRIDNRIALVDLPGYGYAQIEKKQKEAWSQAIQDYLENRTEIGLILLLLDIRRDPNEHDFMMLEWLNNHTIPYIVVFTKIDTFGRTLLEKRKKELQSFIQQMLIDPCYFSAFSQDTKVDLQKRIEKLIA